MIDRGRERERSEAENERDSSEVDADRLVLVRRVLKTLSDNDPDGM